MQWCREMLALSPFALRLLKASFNADEDGLAGIQQLAHDANLLFYGPRRPRRAASAFKAKKRRPTSRSSRAARERVWVAGARPRTLPAAVVPVLVGTACAAGEVDVIVWWRAAAAMVVALAIQVGTNYANDYTDGMRGTDTTSVASARCGSSGNAWRRRAR